MLLQRRYLNFNTEAIILGLRAGILSCLFSLIYVLYNHQTLDFILAVIGVFIVAIIEIVALKYPNRDRIRYGLIISFLAGITIALGSITANHPLLLSLGMILFMLPVGLASDIDPLPATTVLFIANLFIIGSGLVAPVNQAIQYGIYFCGGGITLVISGYLQYIFFKSKYDIRDFQQIQKSNIFRLTTANIKFAIKLSTAVFLANAIAGYLKFPQQYCAPMTALLILRSDHESSIERINHRLFGTLIGSILAGCLIVLVQNKLFLAILMLPVMFLIVVSMARHYGAYVFFLTVMITILFNLIEYEGIKVTLDRIVFTLLGVSSVAIVVYLSKLIANRLNKLE